MENRTETGITKPAEITKESSVGKPEELKQSMIGSEGLAQRSPILRGISEAASFTKGGILGAVAKSTPIGLYVVQDGKFQFVNHRFEQITGYSKEELVGSDSLSYVHPEDRDAVRANAVQSLKGNYNGEFHPYEYRIICKSGESKWIMETVASIQYKGRRATVGNFMDITERKRAEEAFKASEAFNSGILNTTPNPILVTNPDTSIRYVNPALVSLTGFDSAEIVGRKSPYPWWTPETVRVDGDAALDGENSELSERQYRTKNGELFWVVVNTKPFRDQEKVKYRLSTWLDVTEHKHAECALQESEVKFRSLVENAPIGISMTTSDGHILSVNKAMLDIYGYSSMDEFIDSPITARYCDPQDRKRFLERLNKDGIVKDFEVR